MLAEELLPHLYVVEGGLAGDVVDKDDALCIFEVGGDEAAVALLACSVPHLQAVDLPSAGEVSDVEVDADG